MKKVEWIIPIISVIVFIVFATFVGVRVEQKNEIITIQEEKIEKLQREIGEYQAMDSFWEEYMTLLDEIYQGKINEAVLQERVEWLEHYHEPTVSQQQMYDDFEELIEIIIYYYENTDQTVELETYVETNYPELYERIMGY